MAIWLNSESILLALKQDPEVAHLAATYLKYSLIGLPAYAFNSISRYVTRPLMHSRACSDFTFQSVLPITR